MENYKLEDCRLKDYKLQIENLDIWKEVTNIAIEIYLISEKGKLKNDFGMKDQIRRAAMSISDNISEGFEYESNIQFVRFLRYSKGSAGELRNKLYVLYKADFINEKFYHTMQNRLVALSKQISGFVKYLRAFEKNKETIKT